MKEDSENKQPGLQRVKPSQLRASKYAALTTQSMLCNNYSNTCLSASKHGVNPGRSPFVRANISAWAAAVLAFLPGSQDIPCSRLSETGKLGQHRICRIRPDWLSPGAQGLPTAVPDLGCTGGSSHRANVEQLCCHRPLSQRRAAQATSSLHSTDQLQHPSASSPPYRDPSRAQDGLRLHP